MNQSNPELMKFMQGLVVFALTTLMSISIVVAQQKPAETPTPAPAPAKDVSGKYEGSAKTPGQPDLQLTLELKNEAGKVSGRMTTPQGSSDISEGSLTNGKLSVKFGAAGKDGVMTGRIQDDKLVGEWIAGTQKRAVELNKSAPVSAGNSLSGEWTGLANTEGGFSFNLVLNVDGEKVTGSSSSQLGESTISSGSWKDGKLVFVLDTTGGPIAMSATVVDGKLVGDFDYAGQLQGKWVATKKAP
ncbi:MAG: hypothetical protein QOE77_2063 [Blastocatellia bacterium]|jgi:hypothetical protein|nr:hypothetical protein [Blastocatellia bacterium]